MSHGSGGAIGRLTRADDLAQIIAAVEYGQAQNTPIRNFHIVFVHCPPVVVERIARSLGTKREISVHAYTITPEDARAVQSDSTLLPLLRARHGDALMAGMRAAKVVPGQVQQHVAKAGICAI